MQFLEIVANLFVLVVVVAFCHNIASIANITARSKLPLRQRGLLFYALSLRLYENAINALERNAGTAVLGVGVFIACATAHVGTPMSALGLAVTTAATASITRKALNGLRARAAVKTSQ